MISAQNMFFDVFMSKTQKNSSNESHKLQCNGTRVTCCSSGQRPMKTIGWFQYIYICYIYQHSEYHWKHKTWHLSAGSKFKKSLNQEQIKDLYKSPITKRGDFPTHLRCKINVSGSSICRCWDIDNNRTQIPDDLKNCDLVPRIHISHMWMMAKEVGFVLNVIDMMCIPKEEVCPF